MPTMQDQRWARRYHAFAHPTNRKGRINTPFGLIWYRQQDWLQSDYTRGTPPECFWLLSQAKHAHHTRNLASKVVLLAEQCVPPMNQ